jgi:F420-dependent oxidoreductase-like protein
MKFGIKTAPMNTTWQAMLDVWKEADRIPFYDTAWNFDHFEPIFSDRSGPCLEAWTQLALMAAHTSRIRIACQVTGMPYRHPALLANMAATIDIASGGRLTVGLGAGWNADESNALGIPLAPMKERFEQFEEGVALIVALMSSAEGAQTTLPGKHFSLIDAWFEPKSVQRPHPPIAIGGSGEKKTLKIVAKYAQHWNSVGINDTSEWQRKRDVLWAHCADIGRDPSEIECSVNLRFDEATGIGGLVTEAQRWQAAGVDVGIVYLSPPHTPEPLAAIAEALTGL